MIPKETLERLEWLSHDQKPLDEFLESFGDREDGRSYYRFLYYAARFLRPWISVELGVYAGAGSAHLARGNPDGRVFAVDPTPQDLANVLLECPNMHWIEAPSTSEFALKVVDGPVDLLFIDTIHTYEQATAELEAWLPKMRHGDVILFDDISLNEEMARFWAELPLPKVELSHLHHSGFGAAIA